MSESELRVSLDLTYLIFIFSNGRSVTLQSILITSGQNEEICHNQGEIDEQSHEESETQNICCDLSSNDCPEHQVVSRATERSINRFEKKSYV